MKICQIKGTNGSGKTTIVKQLLGVSQDIEELGDKSFIYGTAMNDLGWVAIGRYPVKSKMGGCDTMKTIGHIQAAIYRAMQEKPGYWIVFEGMMVSTIKSTFYNYLLDIHAKNKAIMPVFVILQTTLDGCVNRISGRGTMKADLKYENIYNKNKSILTHAKTYNQRYVRYINVEDLEVSDMLPAFLKAVDDKELLLWVQ